MLLDRDGTVLVHRAYLSDPEEVELVPGAAAALVSAKLAGWGLVVVSNQSGVGRGLFTMQAVQAVNERMKERLASEGAELDGIYVCPDHPDKPDSCRKPGPGMAHRAAAEHGFDLAQSVVVGDNEPDILLANGLGVPAVLVMTGHADPGKGKPDFVIPSLAELMSVLEALS